MKKLLSSLLAAALLLSLTACGPEQSASSGSASDPEPGSTQTPQTTPFTLAVYPEFSLHPVLGANRANLTLSPLLYEPLFRVDEGYQAVPVLCESCSASADKLTWTFTLRSGITFSDGTPLTGETAAGALELARTAEGRYAGRLADVLSFTGEGNTLTAVLSRPNGSLPLLLDIPIALGEGDRPAGTGPYILSDSGDELSLTARDDWWQDTSLPLEAIPLYNVARSDELIYCFDAGNVSLVDVDLMATNAMGYGGNYQTWDYTTTDLLYLGFNTADGLCTSPEVRRTLALAVDRSAIAYTIYAGHAVPSALPVHPDSPLYSSGSAAAAGLAYDPETLVEQVKALKLTGRTLRLLVNSENSSKLSTAQRIAYQLEAAGLTVRLEQLPFEDYTAALARGDFDLYLGETVLTADFDLSPLLSTSGTLNYCGWGDASSDLLLSAFRGAGEADRPAAAASLFALMAQEAPIVPIAFKNGSVLTQWGRVSGLDPLRGNVFYGLENWNISE